MALLEQCFCCSLAVASSVIGVYTLIAYVIAFSMEMWWILQTGASLPSLAYMLCSVYLLIFITSGFLLRGLSIRKTLYLLGWLIAICILSFPEAGLVLFMSIYYWKVRSLYGLTELTCWICRVVVNIAGVICIQSLYSTWREEKHVVRSLQGLHMKSLKRPSNGNGDLKGGRLGYQNAAFSSPVTNSRNSFKVKQIAAPNLKRSASSASQYSIISRINSQQHGGSLPYGINTIDQHSRPASPFVNDAPFLEQEFKSPSEFNASNFDLVLSSAIRNPNHAIANAPLNRTQSMLNITGSLSDLVPRKAMSVVDYPLPTAASTQSLDRRLIRQSQPVMAGPGYFAAGDGRIRNAYFSNGVKKYNPRGNSIGVLYPTNMDYRYPNLYPYNIMNATAFYPRKPKSGSRMSLGNESDDFQKYRDVAL